MAPPQVTDNNAAVTENNGEKTESKEVDSKAEVSLTESKLNPLAKEFVPSYQNQPLGNDGYRRRGNQGRGRYNRKAYRPRDGIRRTVFVSEVDHTISEQELAFVFIPKCGPVVDCRICGDPRSQLRFGFVEFADEQGAKEALELSGTVVGFYAIKVSPSKTAILPVNPIFLPQSPDEKEMVDRTVYCTNIDKMISHADVQFFFESFCGEVTRLRLLGDYVHSTRIAFVEFATTASAITALTCSGAILGNSPIRVSPSKTPVRPSAPRPVQA